MSIHHKGYRGCGKPEYHFSGFFFFLMMTALTSALAGQPPSALASELLWDPADQIVPFPARQDTAAPYARVFITGVYHDIYRRVVTEAAGSKAVLEKTEAYSPQGSAGVIIERERWGGGAGVRTGVVEAHWHGRDRDYDVDATAPLSSMSLAGWTRKGNVRFLAGLGYDAGLPLDYRGFSNSSLIDSIGNVFKDPRFSHLVAGTLVLRNMSLALYETRRPLVNTSARVERQSNHAFVEIPLSAVIHEAGAKAMVSAGRNHSALACAFTAISSDTAIGGENILPASLSGKGLRSSFCFSLGDLRFAPAAEINCVSLQLKIRGYDYEAVDPYCYLDSSTALFVSGRVSVDAPWRLRAGLFGESLAGANKYFGRFDPYLFSGFTIFDPVKYRIDTVTLRYHAIGFFIERSFDLFRRDRAETALAVSYVNSQGSLGTREYDFTYLFPRLINPRTFNLIDEKLLLFAPEVRYTFMLRRLSCTADLRQLIPVSLKGGGGQGGAAATSQNIRGGTTIRVRAEYQW